MSVVWGRRSSSNVQKVCWTLDEVGASYRQIDAGGKFGMVDKDNYLRKNPNGLVPTLEEPDGFILWESNAIVRYLAAKYGAGGLWPEDPRARAVSDRWMDWADTLAKPVINPLFHKLVTRWMPIDDAGEVSRIAERSDKVLRLLADSLEGRAFIGGDTLTLGDIPLGTLLNRWFQLPLDRPPLAAVEAYYDRLKERAAFRRNVVEAPPVV